MNPSAKWRIKASRVEEDTVDPLPTSALSREEWAQVIQLSERWVPPYTAPPGQWSARLPLKHSQRGWQDLCLLCEKGATEGHLMTDAHSKAMSAWEKRGRPEIIIPHQRFGDLERLQMCVQLWLPRLSDTQLQVVMEYILQMEWYKGQAGSYTGPVPPELTAPAGDLDGGPTCTSIGNLGARKASASSSAAEAAPASGREGSSSISGTGFRREGSISGTGFGGEASEALEAAQAVARHDRSCEEIHCGTGKGQASTASSDGGCGAPGAFEQFRRGDMGALGSTPVFHPGAVLLPRSGERNNLWAWEQQRRLEGIGISAPGVCTSGFASDSNGTVASASYAAVCDKVFDNAAASRRDPLDDNAIGLPVATGDLHPRRGGIEHSVWGKLPNQGSIGVSDG
ncbi:unnamed protein product [Symbiodinium necroappetens]|uniref:Uncharacterized protein n=1 Tax=Symbiodinium necroappetens TaxID=1628268 RepID=A0A813B7Q7_9DINO|nr:unnamed protein product [Symbiodinium necroappetens]